MGYGGRKGAQYSPQYDYSQATILYSDGTTQTLSTDSSWRVSRSPVTAADIYKGETYNASLETPGWTTAAYGALAEVWSTATVMRGPGPNVTVTSHAILPPIRIGQSYTPCDMWESGLQNLRAENGF